MSYAFHVTPYTLTGSWYSATTSESKGHKYTYVSGTLQGHWTLDETDFVTTGIAHNSAGIAVNAIQPDASLRPSSVQLTPSLNISPSSFFFQRSYPGGPDSVIYAPDNDYWESVIGKSTVPPGKLTISLWLRQVGPVSVYHGGGVFRLPTIVGVGASTNSFQVEWDGVNFDITANWSSGTAKIEATASPSIHDEKWHHLVLVFDSNTQGIDCLSVYQDGVKLETSLALGTATGTWNGIAGSGGSGIVIGGVHGGDDDYNFNGYICDVAIWNDTLDEDSILALYHAKGNCHKITRDYNTRGSSATLSGSIMPFRQGVSILSMEQRFAGMSPKMAAGSSPIMLIDGKAWNREGRMYDDAIQFAPATTSTSGSVATVESSLTPTAGMITFAPNHEVDRRDYGQPKLFKDDEPFEDMPGFNPVTFLEDGGCSMIYPYILFNVSMKDPDQMDGVIEPLAIRSRASRNSIDWPYEAHRVSGFWMGGAEDSRGWSCPIVQQIDLRHTSFEPYEDGGYEFMGQTMSGSVYIEGHLHDDHETLLPWVDSSDYAEAYENLADSKLQVTHENNLFEIAFGHMSGSIDDINDRDHKSSTAGFEYVGALQGTDSIAFGGLKK